MSGPTFSSKSNQSADVTLRNSDSATDFEPLEPTEELLAELAEQSQRLETASPAAILSWAVERFAPFFSMATAFGPEGMTIIHMLSEIAPETPIFNRTAITQTPEYQPPFCPFAPAQAMRPLGGDCPQSLRNPQTQAPQAYSRIFTKSRNRSCFS